MAAGWFVTRGQKKSGPFSSEQLKQLASQGKLQPTDMVWREGMSSWKPAGEIKGLYPTAAPVSSPMPSAVAPAPPNTSSVEQGSPFEFAPPPQYDQGVQSPGRTARSMASVTVTRDMIGWALLLGILGLPAGLMCGVNLAPSKNEELGGRTAVCVIFGGLLGASVGVLLGWRFGLQRQESERVERWKAQQEQEQNERSRAKVRQMLEEASRCPRCQTLDAREFVREEEIARRMEYETRTVQTPLRATPYSPITGYVDMPTTVQVEAAQFRSHYRCRFCSHPWFVDGPFERGADILPAMRKIRREDKAASPNCTVIEDFQLQGEVVVFSVVGQKTKLRIRLPELHQFMNDSRYFVRASIRARLDKQLGTNFQDVSGSL